MPGYPESMSGYCELCCRNLLRRLKGTGCRMGMLLRTMRTWRWRMSGKLLHPTMTNARNTRPWLWVAWLSSNSSDAPHAAK